MPDIDTAALRTGVTHRKCDIYEMVALAVVLIAADYNPQRKHCQCVPSVASDVTSPPMRIVCVRRQDLSARFTGQIAA